MGRKLWYIAGGCAALTLTWATGPVWAHHAFSAEFDGNSPIKLEGAISKVEFINPHAWIHMDVKTPDGKVETWMVEGGTPNTLQRRGITRDVEQGVNGDAEESRRFWHEWMSHELPFFARERPWEHAVGVVCGTPSAVGFTLDHDVVAWVPRLLRS